MSEEQILKAVENWNSFSFCISLGTGAVFLLVYIGGRLALSMLKAGV